MPVLDLITTTIVSIHHLLSRKNNNGMPDFDKDSDPFGGSGSSIDISDDDLPF